MEIFFIRALQLILALSLLVLVHEFGHFLFARIFKVRVEKFYLFFDWKFSLFKWKPKNSDTEYGIGWIPLGGYCKIAGMIDESMDTEQMNKPAEAWEYRSKPAWQRLLIIVGGVMFNLILATFIYAMVLFAWGESHTDLHSMKNGLVFNETAQEIGFRNGDILTKADGEELHKLHHDKVRAANIFRSICNAKEVTVLRDGKDELVCSLLDLASGTIIDKFENVFLNDGMLALSEELFAGDTLVMDDGQVLSVGLYHKDGSHRVTVHCDGFPNFGVWSMPNAPFVCLEPWMGRCDNHGFDRELSEKPNVNRVAPGETFSASYTIET